MKLYHGSSRKLKILKPKQATGIYKKEDRQIGIYATNNKEKAIAMAMIHLKGIVGPTRMSFPKGEIIGIIFGGWPTQKYFYLYTLSSKSFSKLDEWQYISKENIVPLKIGKLETKNYSHLIRFATKKEKESLQKGLKKFKEKKI